jgi:hypothetical protein
MSYDFSGPRRSRFAVWFLEGVRETTGPAEAHAHQAAWWKVMCLTGVD